MTLNLSELESAIPEILHVVRDGVLSGIECPDRWTCILFFTPAGTSSSDDPVTERKVLFSSRPRLTRLNLLPVGWTREKRLMAENTGTTPEAENFMDAVSRFLAGAVAGPMRTRYSDRVVTLDFFPGKERERFGPARKFTLLFECTGMHPNLFLLDDRQVIRSQFSRSRSKKRRLETGCVYERPDYGGDAGFRTRRVDVTRFVRSGVTVGQQITEMYDPMELEDDKRRMLTDLARGLSDIIQDRRKVVWSVQRDIDAPAREGRPPDLRERLTERLGRLNKEIDEFSGLLESVRAGDTGVVDQAAGIVNEYRRKEEELYRRRGDRMKERGYSRRDDRTGGRGFSGRSGGSDRFFRREEPSRENRGEYSRGSYGRDRDSGRGAYNRDRDSGRGGYSRDRNSGRDHDRPRRDSGSCQPSGGPRRNNRDRR